MMNNRFENKKDSIVGQLKEKAGQLTNDEEMEFKGKYQSMKSDIGDKVEAVKNEVLEKANDFIDRVKDTNYSKKDK